MRAERPQTELKGKYEPFAPPAARHCGCLLRERLRQFIVQREDDGTLVREVTIQECGTDSGPGRDVA
jgi:hypothetical protein